MSGTSSAVGPPKPIQAFQAASTGLGDKPTLADAWQVNARNLAQWLVAQRQSGIEQGLLDPGTGWPTQKALIDAAQQYGGALMGSTEGPRSLPSGLIPKASSQGLKKALDQYQANVLPPESTAYHARRTSPEGVAYGKDLQQKRDAWQRADSKKNLIDLYLEQMREPGITDAGLFKIQSRVQKARDDFGKALEAAKSAGVEYPGAGFPPDIRITIPHGQFPGDEKYAKPSFAPEGYPFSVGPHDYHDPAHWLPDPEPSK